MKNHLNRLFPAANAAALVAALGHVIVVTIAARSIGLELIYIATLTYFVAFIVAVPVGALLLIFTGALKINPWLSLGLFFVVVQSLAVLLQMYFFEITLDDISWQYGLISIPVTFTAWYFSVYYVWKRT